MNIISKIKKNAEEIRQLVAKGKALDEYTDDLVKLFETELEERTEQYWRDGMKQGYDKGLKDGFQQGIDKTLEEMKRLTEEKK